MGQRVLAPLLSLALLACDALDDAPRTGVSAGGSGSGSTAGGAPPGAQPRDAGARSASPAPSAAPSSSARTAPEDDGVLEVRKLTLTPEVDKREPQGTLASAGVDERAYAHLVVRNRRGEEESITVRFSVGGEERSSVDLKISRSWSYRTWAYSTPRRKDLGKTLEVEVFERGGRSLAKASVPISAKAQTR